MQTCQLRAIECDGVVTLYDVNGMAITSVPASRIGLADPLEIEWLERAGPGLSTPILDIEQSVMVCTPATRANLRKLIESQEYRCALTGTPLTPQTASIDHIIPLAEGGKNVIENLEVVRCDINAAKGTMSREAFVRMCREVAAWADG